MRRFTFLFTVLISFQILNAQNVGIGTSSPQSLLHILDGHLRFEGNSKFIDLRTGANATTGLRFYADGVFKGNWFYNSGSQTLNLSNNGNIKGLVYDLSNNKVFLGRDFGMTGSERFGIRTEIAGANFGGMYNETNGNSAGKPFYGYAIDGATKSWHYYDGGDDMWKLSVGGDHLYVKNSGQVGIGIADPLDKLHISESLRLDGVNPTFRFYQGATFGSYLQQFNDNFQISNVENGSIVFKTNNATRMTLDATGKLGIGTSSPVDKLQVLGDFRLDATNPMMKFYQGANFSAFIQQFNNDLFLSNRENGKVFLRTNNLDRVTISEAGNVGIGTNAPIYTMDVNSATARGLDLVNSYSGTATKYGIRSDVDDNGTGNRYGVYGRAQAHAADASSTYGVYGIASGTDSPSPLYGVYGVVTAAGTGSKYALYGNATTAANSWALYANGNAYFDDDVRIGHTNIVSGYRLSVDGKIISEEVKVQMSDNWPDYVFDQQYDLMPLEGVRDFIEDNSHLPGVPSAKEIEENDGFHVGEMNRLLLEKVEELTLYILQQKDAIDAQNTRIEKLEKELSKGQK